MVPSGEFLGRQIPAGVFLKLDKDKLPNVKNMWDEISNRAATYDPGNEYSVNYMWGTTGIGYNKAKIKEALGTDTIDSGTCFSTRKSLRSLKVAASIFLILPAKCCARL